MEEKLQKQINELKREVERLRQRRIYQRDVVFGEIKQVHIDGIIVFRGLAADRPTDGTTEVQAYFAEDTSTLSIWNTVNEAWEGEVLS